VVRSAIRVCIPYGAAQVDLASRTVLASGRTSTPTRLEFDLFEFDLFEFDLFEFDLFEFCLLDFYLLELDLPALPGGHPLVRSPRPGDPPTSPT
jgi:hypothetical protein